MESLLLKFLAAGCWFGVGVYASKLNENPDSRVPAFGFLAAGILLMVVI